MGTKGKITLYVDLEVVREAKELGLNISKVCENALKEAIRRLKGIECKTEHVKWHDRDIFGSKNCVAGPRGIEPRTCGLRAST